MFITHNDYRVVIGEVAFKAISQASPENVAQAEAEAIEEVASYLRPVYDCQAIFAAEGAARNRLLVMRTADIALYHLSASMPQKMGSEIRKERYERAIEWLEGIQAGKIIPDLPVASLEEGSALGTSFRSDPKLNHAW